MTVAAASLESFFDRALEVFHDAARESGGAVAADYAIAGLTMRVHYGSDALAASVGAALTHLAAPAAVSCLRIYVWGGEMQGGLLPPPPWADLDYFERGNVRGYQSDRYVLAYDRRPEVFSAVDNERQLAVYWARDAGGLPYHERSAPMRHLLQGWLQGRGISLAHAAAVGRLDAGALMAGRAGAGKSTTALACLRAGLRYAGDDFVLVSAEPQPYAHCLYNSAKLNTEVLDWLPEAAPLVVNRDQLATEKALLFLSPAWADRVSAGFPLRAVLLPRPTRLASTAASRISSEAAYKAIVPDTLFRALGRGRPASSTLGRLVRALPCYELELGTDLAQVPAVVAEILATHGG